MIGFNRAEPTCYRTKFPYSRSGLQNEAFWYIDYAFPPYIHLRHDSMLRVCLQLVIVVFSDHTYSHTIYNLPVDLVKIHWREQTIHNS